MGHVMMKDGHAVKQSAMFTELVTLVPAQMAKVDPQYREIATKGTQSLFNKAHAAALYLELCDMEAQPLGLEFADRLEGHTDALASAHVLSYADIADFSVLLNKHNNLAELRAGYYRAIGEFVKRVSPEKLHSDPRAYVEEVGLATMSLDLHKVEVDEHVVMVLELNAKMRAAIKKMSGVAA